MCLVQDMHRDGAVSEDHDSEELMKEVMRQMVEPCAQIVDSAYPFKNLVPDFPKIIEKDGQGVSVHLCASDTRRLGPDPTREINVWFTIVDLDVHNPVNVSKGGFLTPHDPDDHREPYLVQGEVQYVLPIEEMDAEDKREEEELEAEHKRLLTSRLARARSASGNSGDSLTSAKPDDDHDDDDGLEQDRV